MGWVIILDAMDGVSLCVVLSRVMDKVPTSDGVAYACSRLAWSCTANGLPVVLSS